MPKTAGNWLQLAFVLFAVTAAHAPARAAVDAGLGPEQARDDAPFVYTVPEGAISFSGFHCGLVSERDAAAFTADPDYSETPPTIGLEFVIDAGGLPLLASTVRPEESAGGEVKTPLSARVNRILITGGPASLTDGSVMEEVYLPEASMSVADLVGRCLP